MCNPGKTSTRSSGAASLQLFVQALSTPDPLKKKNAERLQVRQTIALSTFLALQVSRHLLDQKKPESAQHQTQAKVSAVSGLSERGAVNRESVFFGHVARVIAQQTGLLHGFLSHAAQVAFLDTHFT